MSRTYDGLRVQPLYPRAAGAPVIAGRPAAPWQVMQRVDHPDAKAANAEALHELENGATGLSWCSPAAPAPTATGSTVRRETIARALEGVHLDAGIAIELDMSRQHIEAGAASRRAGDETAALRPATDEHPLRLRSARRDCRERRRAAAVDELAATFAKRIVAIWPTQGFEGPFAVADGRSVHAAGGAEAQELAFVVANAVEYLRALRAPASRSMPRAG